MLSFFFVFGCCICVSRLSGREGGKGKRKEIDTIDKQWQAKKKTKPRRIAVHRRREKTKNRCFISRKTPVIGSPDVSFIRISVFGLVKRRIARDSNAFDNIVQCFVERLRTDLIFVWMVRMFHRQERRMWLHGNTWDYVAFISNMHDILTHKFFKGLSLVSRC